MSDPDERELLRRLDPDWDHVPLELRLADQSPIADPDGTAAITTLVVAPGLFGHAARLQERPESP